MVNSSPHYVTQRKPNLSIIIAGVVLIMAVGGCSAVQPPATAITPDPPTKTPASSPTPTPTPIPPPQGEWSQYWNNNYMYDLVIDGEGYLWGQGSGTIIRWNTREGTYQEFGTAQGLPANKADQIFLGPSGEVWLYFLDQGLWQFDDPDWISHIETGEIEGYRLDATALGPDGTLWVCTEESLSRFDGEEWFSLDVIGGMVEGICVYLTIDLDGNPWLQGVGGPSAYKDPDLIVYTIQGVDFKYNKPQGAYTGPDGKIWFAYGGDGMLWFDGTYWDRAKIPPKDFVITSSGKAWLLRDMGFFQPDSLSEYIYGNYLKVDIVGGTPPVFVSGWHWNLPFHNRMPVDKISRMYPGVNNELWMTYQNGLIHLTGGVMDLIPIDGITYAEAINDLEVSRSSEVYLALPDGIHKLTGRQTQPLLADSKLIGSVITKLAVDSTGTVWMVSNRGLQTFDGNSWAKPDLPGSSVHDLAQGSEGEIWVANYPYLSRWDGNRWESYNSEDIEGLPDRRITSMFVDTDGVLWLGFSSDGLISYNGTDWTAYLAEEESGIGWISDIAKDSAGTIYLIPYSDKEYSLFWLKDQGWQNRDLEESAVAIRRHPDGALWILLSSGRLYALDDGELLPVDLENPAPDAAFYDLVFTPDGSIWLATSQGAFRYNGLAWESYNAANGLRENKVNTLAAGPDGTVWFAGSSLTRLGPP